MNIFTRQMFLINEFKNFFSATKSTRTPFNEKIQIQVRSKLDVEQLMGFLNSDGKAVRIEQASFKWSNIDSDPLILKKFVDDLSIIYFILIGWILG